MNYSNFIAAKQHSSGEFGFDPIFMPDAAFDFQEALIDWSVKKGRAAIFADCGMGKTLMQLGFGENVVRKTNKPVILLAPLAVGFQTVKEAAKFGIQAIQCRDGKHDGSAKIIVTNYERLHYFDPDDFAGTICDESSILKNYDGATRLHVTEFMKKHPYRLLCTATAAPNDFIELGTSSEALGHMGFVDMLGKFFKKSEKTTSRRHEHMAGIYRFRGHAERDFWRWVCSWARALRKPSDMGFDDMQLKLPELITNQHIINSTKPMEGFLIPLPAVGLSEQRDERSITVQERCELASQLVIGTKKPAVQWCYLDREGDLLARLTPDAVQISGKDSEERKEEVLNAFADGQIRVLVTKPKLSGFGLNWQHCSHQTFFPSHSFEQFYQSIRRSWRFGQKEGVVIDVITSEGESNVLRNLQRKAVAAEEMFQKLISLMSNELNIKKAKHETINATKPSWI